MRMSDCQFDFSPATSDAADLATVGHRTGWVYSCRLQAFRVSSVLTMAFLRLINSGSWIQNPLESEASCTRLFASLRSWSARSISALDLGANITFVSANHHILIGNIILFHFPVVTLCRLSTQLPTHRCLPCGLFSCKVAWYQATSTLEIAPSYVMLAFKVVSSYDKLTVKGVFR